MFSWIRKSIWSGPHYLSSNSEPFPPLQSSCTYLYHPHIHTPIFIYYQSTERIPISPSLTSSIFILRHRRSFCFGFFPPNPKGGFFSLLFFAPPNLFSRQHFFFFSAHRHNGFFLLSIQIPRILPENPSPARHSSLSAVPSPAKKRLALCFRHFKPQQCVPRV